MKILAFHIAIGQDKYMIFKDVYLFMTQKKSLFKLFPWSQSVSLHSINVLQTVLVGDGDFKSEQDAFGLIHINGAF